MLSFRENCRRLASQHLWRSLPRGLSCGTARIDLTSYRDENTKECKGRDRTTCFDLCCRSYTTNSVPIASIGCSSVLPFGDLQMVPLYLENPQNEYRRYFSGKKKGDKESKDGNTDDDEFIEVEYNKKGVSEEPNFSPHDDTGIDRSKFTHEVKVRMPDVGDDLEGVVEKWYKKEGDLIKKDDVLCDIGTELFTFGMVTDDEYDSIMGEIKVPEQSEPVQHGTVLCTTLHEEDIKEKEEQKK